MKSHVLELSAAVPFALQHGWIKPPPLCSYSSHLSKENILNLSRGLTAGGKPRKIAYRPREQRRKAVAL